MQTPVVFRSNSGKTSYLTQDVSFSGLFVRTDAPPRLRQLVKIEMALPPDGESFSGLAMCVFVVEPGDPDRAPGAGVQFYGLGDEQQQQWNAFVAHVRASAKAAHRSNRQRASAATEGPASETPPPPEERTEVADAIRRRHQRVAAVIEVEPESLDDLVKLYTRDISKGGMFLVTEHQVPVGTVIRLDVRHPAIDEVFDLECAVKRVETEGEERGLGVEFIEMDEERLESFRHFVHDLLDAENDTEGEPIDESQLA